MKMFGSKPFINVILLDQDFRTSEKLESLLSQRSSVNKIYTFRDGIEAVDITKNDMEIKGSRINYLIIVNIESNYSKEFLSIIKNNHDFNVVPVIIMSDKTEQELSQSFVLPSNCYFVQKNEVERCLDITESIENYSFIMNNMKDNISHKHLSYML
ncbi:MAG: hypothetical protein AABZ74_02245 [Cyanobacteriota bacterium]